MELTNQEIEDERRRGRIAGALGILGVLLSIISLFLATDFTTAGDAEQLQLFDSVKGELSTQLLMQALAYFLFAPALVALFRAVRARSESVRPGLIGLVFASPILLGLSAMLAYFAFKEAADAFLAPGGPLDSMFDDVKFEGNLQQADTLQAGIATIVDDINGLDDQASSVLLDQFPTQLRTGLGLAGALGMAFSTVYMALHAMRAGLMTRFWGTLAMAVGIGTLLFGPPMLIVYMILTSLLLAGWWPRSTRPPAWDAGKAVPWPAAGRPGDAEPREDQLAAPADFEGSATEVEPEPDPGDTGDAGGPQKRKRKRRS